MQRGVFMIQRSRHLVKIRLVRHRSLFICLLEKYYKVISRRIFELAGPPCCQTTAHSETNFFTAAQGEYVAIDPLDEGHRKVGRLHMSLLARQIRWQNFRPIILINILSRLCVCFHSYAVYNLYKRSVIKRT